MSKFPRAEQAKMKYMYVPRTPALKGPTPDLVAPSEGYKNQAQEQDVLLQSWGLNKLREIQ